MTWPPLDQPPERFSVGAWFRPSRWSTNDILIAVAALVLAGSVFAPWFKATIGVNGYNGQTLRGFLIEPKGTVTGIAVHRFLWVLVALALAQLAFLMAHYVPGRFAFAPPSFRRLLIGLSALSVPIVLVACVLRPDTWKRVGPFPPNFHLTVDWSYGAGLALAAAVAALVLAVLASQGETSP